MQWEFIVALILGIPVILFPVALVWYLNIGGIYSAIQKERREKALREKGARAVREEHPAHAEPVSSER